MLFRGVNRRGSMDQQRARRRGIRARQSLLLAAIAAVTPGAARAATPTPAIGLNFSTSDLASSVALGNNHFTNGSAGGTLSSVALYSIPKADLLGTPTLANLTRLHNLDPNTDGFTIQPVTNLGTSIGHAPMVAGDNAFFSLIDRETITN